jgi:hypothetical protein
VRLPGSPSKTPPTGRPAQPEPKSAERSTVVPDVDPAPHADAAKLAVERREALERECLSSVGSASAILVLAVTPEELKTFALDNVNGFLLSLIDGSTDVQTLLDICGLPRLVALRRLRGLIEHGILVVASRVRPRS